jgi:hypothetical protein
MLVHVAPILLGDGVRPFCRPGTAFVELEPIGVSQSGWVANLRYRVLKP